MEITLTESLKVGQDERALRVLEHYFRPLSGINTGFTGGQWDTFDPSGARAASADKFTADDLVACSLLSAPIDGRAAWELLSGRFDELLAAVGPDREFVALETTEDEAFEPVRSLYRALDSLPRIGMTRATKLLARKRPNLVPIIDQVILKEVFGGARRQWQPLHAALIADDHALWTRLEKLRSAAGLGTAVPVLRIFDVLAWMDGSGNADRAMAGLPIVDAAEPDGAVDGG